jgi:hypothetical protein
VSDHDIGPLPELTPEQESEVRRLLAEARHDEPVPADVAARLDDVLADLTREAPARLDEPVAPVIDLTARRRRRNAAALLAGAAAVIVAGFAIGQGIDMSGDSADDNSASGGSAVARDEAGGAESASSDLRDGVPSTVQAKPEPDELRAPVQLRSAHLRRDIVAQMSVLTADQSLSAASGEIPEAYGADYECPTPSAAVSTYGIGDLFPAYYDGAPAVLALGPISGGTREAHVLSCTSGEPLRSVTVRAP